MLGECHAHVFMDGQNYRQAVARHKEGVCEEAVRRELERYRDAGVTFVRDGGDAYGVSALAKRLAGEYGIDYRTPVFAIHKRGHYGGIVGLAFDSREEYRRLVRRAMDEGADFIKIMVSGIMDFAKAGILSEEGLPEEEIRAMIGIAHDAGMAVMAHCNGDETCRYAIRAEVDSLEHGVYMEEETLTMLAGSRTVWIPTISPIGNLLGCGRFPDEEVKKNLDGQRKRVRRAVCLGARIGLGSDAGAYLVPHGGGTMDEYAYLTDVGVTDARLRETEKQIRQRFKR